MKTELTHTWSCSICCARLFVALFLGIAVYPIFAAPQVTIKARFVQFQAGSGWPEKFDWYPKATAINGGQSFSSMLTDSQFKEVLTMLQQRRGADLLNQ